MFELFLKKLPKDTDIQEKNITDDINILPDGLRNFVEKLWGYSFWNGIYRTFTSSEVIKYSKYCQELFFSNTKKYYFFWSNWNGCLFGIDIEDNQIILFEPETPEDYKVPYNIIDFHNNEIFSNSEALLRLSFLVEWRKKSNSILNRTQCIWYIKPLFLWGTDTIDNLELTDLEVYISITGQLWNATKNLPEWTKIGKIEIE